MSKTKAEILEDLKAWFEWEGGMDECLLNVGSPASLNTLKDQSLTIAAERFVASYTDLEKEWERICEENKVDPYP